jgi:thymidylate kinase
MAWIIIEGCTATGKSTLYEALDEQLRETGRDVNTVHMGRPDELTRRWALNEYVLGWEALDSASQHVLADRWAWGERTYAPIYRPDTNKDGYGLLGVAGWRWVELFLMSRGATTVYLHAAPKVLVERLEERGDDHVQNSDELLQVAALYADTVDNAPSVHLRFNTGLNSHPTDLADLVMDIAVKAESDVSPLSAWPEYIGSPKPAALLLGDRRNVTEKYGEETQLPFMPVNGNSGDFLLSALPDPFWKTVGLVNANEITDLLGLWKALGRPPIVALGTEAARAAEPLAVQAHVISHPQWTRRFAHARRVEYGQAIQSLAQTGKAVEWTQSAR